MRLHIPLAILTVTLVFPSACKPHDKTTPPIAAAAVHGRPDVPLLPIIKNDFWSYDVHLQIPADITSPGAAEVDERHRLTRTYLGKVTPAAGLPEVDCFEVVVPATPVEREFVEIFPDKILLRGSLLMHPDTTRPMWLDHAVPFVIADMKAGTETPEIQVAGGSLSRKTQVIAREQVTVPAGVFPAIRLLMTGLDGELELKRTIWFAPGTGIVREEKARYRKGKLILRETQELLDTSVRNR